MCILASLLIGSVPALIASTDVPYVQGGRGGKGGVSTTNVTAIAQNGVPGYSYLWQYVSGDTFGISSSTLATTHFTYTLAVGDYKSAFYRCRITDALGQIAYTDPVQVVAMEVSYV